MKIQTGTRICQTQVNKKRGTYTLYNNKLGQQLEINLEGLKILRKIQANIEYRGNGCKDSISFIKQLVNIGFICENDAMEEESNIFLLSHCKYRYPLSAVTLEITNLCNLRCKHCYGSFSNVSEIKYLSLESIKLLIGEMNKLHTLKVAITGGEVTLHPQFVEIALLLLKSGFNLSILTNGYNYIKIKELLELSQDYRYTVKVSLDACENIHNQIRGRKDAFINAIKTINNIVQYSNITLYISTVIMKDNVQSIAEIQNYIREEFPTAIHTFDFVFPMGNAKDTCALSIEEIKDVLKKYPELIEDNKSDGVNTKKFRCSAGITQCTISYDGSLRICNSACDNKFVFKYNVNEKALSYAWTRCGKNIRRFRHERVHTTKDCKKCSKSMYCTKTDCRVLALAYTGNISYSNPLTCLETNILCERNKLNETDI